MARPISQRTRTLSARLDELAPTWQSLDPEIFDGIALAVQEIELLDPAMVPSGQTDLDGLERRSAALRNAARLLGELHSNTTLLLDHYGASPNGACAQADCHRALRLATLSSRRAVLDPAWLHPLGRMRARAALLALQPLAERQHQLLERLTPLFTDRILFIELDSSSLGVAPASRMSSRQRSAIIGCARSGMLGPAERGALALVPFARSVQRQLRAAERCHASALGCHYAGNDTVFSLIGSSLDLLDEVAGLLDEDADLADFAEMAERLVRPGGSQQHALDLAIAVAHDLAAWQELAQHLSLEPASLLRQDIYSAGDTCRRVARHLDELRATVQPVAAARGTRSNLGELADIAADIADLRDLIDSAVVIDVTANSAFELT